MRVINGYRHKPLLLIAGKSNVVGSDGVQKEPVEAWQIPVNLHYTGQDNYNPNTIQFSSYVHTYSVITATNGDAFLQENVKT